MPNTQDSAQDRIIELICDELGLDLDFDEVSDQSHLVDDLGAHSLDVVEVVMRLEDEFGIEIPDEEVEGLQTVGSFVNYVTNNLQKANPVTRPDVTVVSGKTRTDQHTERILNHIIQSKEFRKFYKDLELDEGEIVRLLRRIIGNRPIYYVTTRVIKNAEEKEAECVHLFLLGKQNLFYFKLLRKSVMFEWAALKDLRLTYEVSLDHNRKISMISVKSNSREASLRDVNSRATKTLRELECQSEESLHNIAFEFEGELEIEGALDFLDKYLANLEDEE